MKLLAYIQISFYVDYLYKFSFTMIGVDNTRL